MGWKMLLREKCPNTEFILVSIFLYSNWIQIQKNTDQKKLHIWTLFCQCAITQLTDFLNGPMVDLLSYCHIILHWEQVTFYYKFSHNFKLEKIQRFSAIARSTEKYWKVLKQLHLQKFQLKWKRKASHSYGTNIFLRRYTKIYRHLLSKRQFLDV